MTIALSLALSFRQLVSAIIAKGVGSMLTSQLPQPLHVMITGRQAGRQVAAALISGNSRHKNKSPGSERRADGPTASTHSIKCHHNQLLSGQSVTSLQGHTSNHTSCTTCLQQTSEPSCSPAGPAACWPTPATAPAAALPAAWPPSLPPSSIALASGSSSRCCFISCCGSSSSSFLGGGSSSRDSSRSV